MLRSTVHVFVRLLTVSYYPRLQHYTVRPIRCISKHADDPMELKTLLSRFRDKKKRDIDFVRLSVGSPRR